MGNDKEDHPDTHNEPALLSRLTSECRTKLEEGLGAETIIFLISGKLRNIGNWDFPDLSKKLIESIPEIKRDALILSLQCNSKEIINRKCEVLRRRIWKVAGWSALGGAIPLPVVPPVIDTGVMVHEVREYIQQLGLDEETLKSLSERHRVELNNLIAKVGVANVTRAVAGVAAHMAAEGLLKFFVPILGSITGAAMSFGTTRKVLEHFLSKLHNAALEIADLTIEAANI